MKKIILAIGMVFSMNAFSSQYEMPSPPLKLMPEILSNVEMLDISDEQLMELRLVAKRNHFERDLIIEEFNKLQSLLSETILMKGDNKNKISEIKQEITALISDYFDLSSSCVNKVKNILNEEQYDEAVESYLFKN